MFSPKAEFTTPLHVHITLATDTDPASLRLTQLLVLKHSETRSIQVTFKRVFV